MSLCCLVHLVKARIVQSKTLSISLFPLTMLSLVNLRRPSSLAPVCFTKPCPQMSSAPLAQPVNATNLNLRPWCKLQDLTLYKPVSLLFTERWRCYHYPIKSPCPPSFTRVAYQLLNQFNAPPRSITEVAASLARSARE